MVDRCKGGRPPAWGISITVWLSRVIPPRELHLVHGVRRCDQLVVEMLGSSKGAEKDRGGCSDEDAEVDGQSEGSLLREMLLGGG